MRKKSLFSVLSILILLSSCSLTEDAPMPVDPVASTPQYKTTSNACGTPDTLLLATTAGDMDINYCGSLPCFFPQPAWGEVISYNYMPLTGPETQVLELNLEWGWYVTEIRCLIGDNNSFSLDANSDPVIEPHWTEQVFYPEEPTASLSQEILGYPNCSMVGFCLKVYKKDFLGGLDAASERILWVYNENWNNPSLRNLNTPSPLLTNLCPKPCPVVQSSASNLIF